jgi:Galactose mutarotase-like
VQFLVKLDLSPAEPILTMKGMLFDQYLHWVKMEAAAQKSDSEDSFRGVFGLGERATNDFFFKTGVYSMWAKDIDNPTENGKLPGSEVYGVHPFYMFKHAQRSWVGVFHNLA